MSKSHALGRAGALRQALATLPDEAEVTLHVAATGSLLQAAVPVELLRYGEPDVAVPAPPPLLARRETPPFSPPPPPGPARAVASALAPALDDAGVTDLGEPISAGPASGAAS